MALSKTFTTITPFSKLLSIFLFLSLPFVGFYLGMLFQQSITPQYPPLQYDPATLAKPVKTNPVVNDPIRAGESSPGTNANNGNAVMCPQDAKQCADGSWVGRTGPNCDFVCPK